MNSIDEEVLRAADLTKSFPGVRALDNITVSFRRGTIHGLIGQNGAGKSTLVNILAGVFPPDHGEIIINNEPVRFGSPKEAISAGIGVLFQELSLCPNLSVAENLFLEKRTRWLSLVDRRRLGEEAEGALQRVGLYVDPRKPVSSLSLADQQLVAFARALRLSPRILILDEPTSALSAQEIDRLAQLLQQLKTMHVTIVYITHRLHEVIRLCDVVTVLRDGQHVATRPVGEVSVGHLVELMVGAALATFGAEAESSRNETAAPVLQIKGWIYGGHEFVPDLDLRPGEVLGLLGLAGSGREHFLHSLAGLARGWDIRELVIRGRPVPRNPTKLYRRGLGLVPANRHTEGLFPLLSVQENVGLGVVRATGWWRSLRREKGLVQSLLRRLRVRVSRLGDPVQTLSGGNQQKVVLARVLAARSRILTMDEPTQGVDVASREEIYRIIRELAAEGVAFVIGSADPEELARVCTRVWVVYGGTFEAAFSPPYRTEELMGAATGARRVSTAAKEQLR